MRGQSGTARALRWAAFLVGLWAACPAARAQQQQQAADPARLDVERLPPEPIEVTRDMFERGLFVQGCVGARGFAGGAGRVSSAGPFARIGLGYELGDAFLVGAALELSLHETDAAGPPSRGVFQVMDVLIEARMRWPISARAALFGGLEAGLDAVPGNLLQAHGLPSAGSVGFIYGGSLGFDWHLLSRHHSVGLLAGARAYPNLEGPDAEPAVGIHSAAYLAYVF